MINNKKKIGVLQVLDTLNIGGAEQLVLTLMEGIDKDRFRPVVCTLFSRESNKPEPLADELRSLGIKVYQLAMTKWSDYKTIKQFLNILDNELISIVHSHMLPADFWGCFLAKVFRGKKTVYTKHSILPFPNSTYKAQHFVLNRFIADKIIAISELVKSYLITNCYSPPRKIIKIFNAIDINKFHNNADNTKIKKELNISTETIIVGNTSRFESFKGYNYFINVAEKITKRHSNIKFLAVGHGPELKNIRKSIQELHLENKVILCNPRRDIPQVLGAIDIYLFPILWGEGFGISLAEAMASGKAIVASNVGPVPELVENGTSGLLPTPKPWKAETESLNTDALTNTVECLIRDEKLRIKLGKAARKRAKDLFSASEFVKNTETLYEKLATS